MMDSTIDHLVSGNYLKCFSKFNLYVTTDQEHANNISIFGGFLTMYQIELHLFFNLNQIMH